MFWFVDKASKLSDVFDVDDLFNNTVGAVLGGLIAVAVMRVWGRKN